MQASPAPAASKFGRHQAASDRSFASPPGRPPLSDGSLDGHDSGFSCPSPSVHRNATSCAKISPPECNDLVANPTEQHGAMAPIPVVSPRISTRRSIHDDSWCWYYGYYTLQADAHTLFYTSINQHRKRHRGLAACDR
jgi:hypothetical protein